LLTSTLILPGDEAPLADADDIRAPWKSRST
jgi:hypothetical protein